MRICGTHVCAEELDCTRLGILEQIIGRVNEVDQANNKFWPAVKSA